MATVLQAESATIQVTASRRRWAVLALLFAITVINFIDRQTVSVLAPVLREMLYLTNTQYGRVVAAFQFGMMTGELPMGALMDRWGVRLGLSGAVLWWSAATAAQTFTRTGTQLGLTRFWMGTGECGNYSGGLKVVSQLFQKKERTLAIGIFNTGSMIGATVATPLIVYLLHRFGFRSAFLFAASLGLLWVPLWWTTYREPKADIASAAKQAISAPRVPLRDLLHTRSLWAVMLCRFFIGPVLQFYWYWIPSYLFSSRHLSMTQIGLIGWIPFLLGDFGGIAGGWTSGFMQRRGIETVRVRKITMFASSIVCMASLLVPHTPGIAFAFVLIGIAMLANNFLSANMFASFSDLFGEGELGRVTGFTGVASGLSGLLFPLLTGVLVDHFSYTPVFMLVALMPLLGSISLLTLGGPGYRRLTQQAEPAR
jgi:ACS family hexuronate transporter-like MFS transporter